MTQPHPSAPAGDPAAAVRFVTLSLAPAAAGPSGAPDAPDVVLARADAPLRPDALVVAREPLGYAVRRVARVTPDAVELVGDGSAPGASVDAPRVLGTVLLRWHVESAA